MVQFIDALAEALPKGALVTDQEVIIGYGRDQAGLTRAGRPLALVRPTSTQDVQAVVRISSSYGMPVVPRGAGSGLSGGANAVDDCVVLDMMCMNRILGIEPGAMLAVVQPGVINGRLKEEVSAFGLWYPPDPASYEFSSIGGNVATNAGGLCCVKYGVTRDYVLGLEVVLADGSVLRTGRRTIKGTAGYDLTALFVGSEGTLGIITEVTIRLRPRPPPTSTLVAHFPDLSAVGMVISNIARRFTPSLLEVMDRQTVCAVEEWKPMDLDTNSAALVLASVDVDAGDSTTQIDGLLNACSDAGATYVAQSDDPEDTELLLAARRLAYPALERLGSTVLDDVAVPIDRIPDMMRKIEQTADEERVTIGTFGHAGDGNLHPTVVFDGNDSASVESARRAFTTIVTAAIELGGTVTGEHGVGLLKVPFLEQEIGPAGMKAHRMIKAAFDPHSILNRGKVVPGSSAIAVPEVPNE